MSRARVSGDPQRSSRRGSEWLRCASSCPSWSCSRRRVSACEVNDRTSVVDGDVTSSAVASTARPVSTERAVESRDGAAAPQRPRRRRSRSGAGPRRRWRRRRDARGWGSSPATTSSRWPSRGCSASSGARTVPASAEAGRAPGSASRASSPFEGAARRLTGAHRDAPGIRAWSDLRSTCRNPATARAGAALVGMAPRVCLCWIAVGAVLVACSSTSSNGVTSETAPAPSTEPEDPVPAEVEAPPGDAVECRLLSVWDAAPSSVCTDAAASCIARAKTAGEASDCIRGDTSCADCYRDVMRGCLVGVAGKPGPCAGAAGCVDGCVASACGTRPTDTCRRTALRGACLPASKQLDACLACADHTPCMGRFDNECLPKASCGNASVDAGETCDGNCPTSCASVSPGDLCTAFTLKGSAATCSAVCEKQSRAGLS
jgi:hypothetical protein